MRGATVLTHIDENGDRVALIVSDRDTEIVAVLATAAAKATHIQRAFEVLRGMNVIAIVNDAQKEQLIQEGWKENTGLYIIERAR